ncbi:hypothetical protein BO70DRAFT_54505 [Aspergillus heteromorphus CBS 117.55]|uniref:Uncharacterized protein n=1 Tax=Aspergillus heteromorphus CBS 117.55 TaxID=1448321 RepID=A0A317W1J2_9EURO|nr:uncharacterized protein BO70DRAFT_54505 [Aspergillus heteromorphus CBS 117.55]PWY79107.1 hypothetical protein BO70DRAFT_54505 [Aspergillus heteromorphus CBS 117.55]
MRCDVLGWLQSATLHLQGLLLSFHFLPLLLACLLACLPPSALIAQRSTHRCIARPLLANGIPWALHLPDGPVHGSLSHLARPAAHRHPPPPPPPVSFASTPLVSLSLLLILPSSPPHSVPSQQTLLPATPRIPVHGFPDNTCWETILQAWNLVGLKLHPTSNLFGCFILVWLPSAGLVPHRHPPYQPACLCCLDCQQTGKISTVAS